MNAAFARAVIKLGMVGALCAVALATSIGAVSAQDYPNKPRRLVVASSPGSVADVIARVLGTEMSKDLGQSFVVETKPGANQIIGIEYLAKQMPADGYTAAVLTVDALALLPVTVKNLRFDPIKDLQPVTGLVEGRLVFGSYTAAPWKTFNELIAYARANPGKLNYGASSPTVMIPMAAIIHEFGLNIAHIPYAGAAPYFQGLTGGEVHMGFIGTPSTLTLGERFKPIAITGAKRSETFPNLQTFTELNLPYIRGSSHALSVRAGTAMPIVEKLNTAAQRALQQPAAKTTFGNLKLETIGEGPEAAVKRLVDQAKFFSDMAAKIGLQPQ